MKILLEYGDHEVLIALDGEEGLEAAIRESPELIILDILLPKMDGIELNKHLLKNERTSRIPVIVVSTQGSTDNSLVSAKNVKLYLQKPFDVGTLLEEIPEGPASLILPCRNYLRPCETFLSAHASNMM